MKTKEMADRIEVTRRVIAHADALAGEGFARDDIVDALFAAAWRRIAENRETHLVTAEYQDWASDIARLDEDCARR